MDEFWRLKEVAESPLFGKPEGKSLLNANKDILTIVLENNTPNNWNIDFIVNAAWDLAMNRDEFSLVAPAALSRDAVILAALRESVVLYAVPVAGCAKIPKYEYIWEVDEVIQDRASMFVQTYNDLFDDYLLPSPVYGNAEIYWNASGSSTIIGRCVRIGYDDSVQPTMHYHWAIEHGDNDDLVVKEFWDSQVWSTSQYREKLGIWEVDRRRF